MSHTLLIIYSIVGQFHTDITYINIPVYSERYCDKNAALIINKLHKSNENIKVIETLCLETSPQG